MQIIWARNKQSPQDINLSAEWPLSSQVLFRAGSKKWFWAERCFLSYNTKHSMYLTSTAWESDRMWLTHVWNSFDCQSFSSSGFTDGQPHVVSRFQFVLWLCMKSTPTESIHSTVTKRVFMVMSFILTDFNSNAIYFSIQLNWIRLYYSRYTVQWKLPNNGMTNLIIVMALKGNASVIIDSMMLN